MEKEEKIEKLLDSICEIICNSIEQPAGKGCGYGITEDGQHEMRIAINDFLLKTN